MQAQPESTVVTTMTTTTTSSSSAGPSTVTATANATKTSSAESATTTVTTTISSNTLTTTHSAIAQQQCYKSDGSNSTDTQCSTWSLCCPCGTTCYDNGMCVPYTQGGILQTNLTLLGTCVDRNWGSDCPQFCKTTTNAGSGEDNHKDANRYMVQCSQEYSRIDHAFQRFKNYCCDGVACSCPNAKPSQGAPWVGVVNAGASYYQDCAGTTWTGTGIEMPTTASRTLTTTSSSKLSAPTKRLDCYHPNGLLSQNDHRCSFKDVTQHDQCCPCGSMCGSTGICLYSEGITIRATCTDADYKDGSCPTFCPGYSDRDRDMTVCSNDVAHGTNVTHYCCGIHCQCQNGLAASSQFAANMPLAHDLTLPTSCSSSAVSSTQKTEAVVRS